jgi:hypothetical protein
MISVSEPIHDESPVAEAVPPETAGAMPSKGNMLVIAAVALAAFSSTLSAVGLVVTSRTVAEASIAIEQFQADGDHRAGQQKAASVAMSVPAPAPVATHADGAATAAQVQRMVDSLRNDIARYQTAKGGAPLVATISDGQAELANRLSVINAKLDDMARQLSSTRAATPAAGRARPS